MISDTDATYPKSMIISLDDPRVKHFKYKPGDQFLLRQDSLEEPGWDPDLVEELTGHTVVINVVGYELDIDGEEGYSCQTIMGPIDPFPWVIPEAMIESDFIYLGRDNKNIRFALIDE